MTMNERKQMLLAHWPAFLILTISNLSRSCMLVKSAGPNEASIFALDRIDFVPDKEEIELLQSH